MTLWKPIRKLYIKTTDFTHGFQGESREKILGFYRLWAFCYDFSVKLDPAYARELKKMIDSVVKRGDTVLDLGCGTGLGTIYASRIADKVVGIDLSPQMTTKLQNKIRKERIENIEVVVGGFPEDLARDAKFNSVISSFAIAHFPPEQRSPVYSRIFDHLVSNGRVGLFSARGEIASTFETRNNVVENLKLAGFRQIEVDDVSDIYRIVKAEKP